MILNKQVSRIGQKAFAGSNAPVLTRAPVRSRPRKQAALSRPSSALATRSRQQLVRLLDELQSELEHCQAELRKDGASLPESDDSAERASQIVLTSTLNHLTARIREVERALDLIGSGSYGKCTDCGQRIAQSRLKANPTAQRCVRCQVVFETPRGQLPRAG